MVFDGEKLRLARLFLGIPLEEVGRRVSASRQYIHQLETGAKLPNELMMRALAVSLGVKPKFFSLPGGRQVQPEQAHFRKLRTTPVSERRQMLAFATLFEQLANQLDDVLKLPTVDIPEHIPTSDAAIDRIAEQCRLSMGLSVDRPVSSMTRVLERAGALVVSFATEGRKVDALSVHRARPIVVRATGKQSVFRQRFDLAHELGHLVMHSGVETGDRATEAQANKFASAFLMPREMILAEFPHRNLVTRERVYKFKFRMGVSAAAIHHRLHEMRIIDSAQYRRINIRTSKDGHRTSEPGDNTVELEVSEVLPQCLELLKSQSANAIPDLMERLGVEPDFFARLVGDDFPFEGKEHESKSNVVSFPSREEVS